MADSIQISVQGSHTHFAPAERCIVSFQVSKEGDSQASVVQAVTTLSDDLTDLFRSLCPKDTATGRLAVEYVDDPNVAITHWSMSSLSTSNWKVQAGKNGEKEKSARRYRASTGFFVKFKDFAKMSEICSDLAKNDNVFIYYLDWRLTDITRNRLKPQVRKKAVLDAVEKAKGYCSAFSPSEDTEWVCEPVEISDNSPTLSYGHDDDEAVLMSSLGHGEAGGEDLKFEPEDVSLSTGVDCTFKCYQKAV